MKNKRKEQKIEMALGGQIIYRVKDGFKVRRKSSLDADRVKTDPAFKKTMQNAADFTTAVYAGRMLREALNTAIVYAKDSRMSLRLMAVMRAILKTDMYNLRGQRTVLNGDLAMLHGFQFNAGRPLAASFLASWIAGIDRVSGVAQVTIPSYKPGTAIAPPPGATHYVLHIAATAVDFDTGRAVTAVFEMQPLAVGDKVTSQTVLSAQLPSNSHHPLFLVLGIYFLQLDNGEYYPIGGRAYNALAIVDVENE